MGKIIDRVRQRKTALQAKEQTRRYVEAEIALIDYMRIATGPTWLPMVFVVAWVGFVLWVLYMLVWG